MLENNKISNYNFALYSINTNLGFKFPKQQIVIIKKPKKSKPKKKFKRIQFKKIFKFLRKKNKYKKNRRFKYNKNNELYKMTFRLNFKFRFKNIFSFEENKSLPNFYFN